MSSSSNLPPNRSRAAIGLSILMHACALLLLAALLGDRPVARSSAVDEGSVFAVTTIVKRALAPSPSGPVAAPAGRRERGVPEARPLPAPAPRATARAAVKAAAAVALRARVPVATRAAPPAPRIVSLGVLLARAAPPATIPTPRPTAVSMPPPTPAPTATPVAATNFGGLFSQNYPPAFASPADLAAIRARLDGPVRIRVEIDETGQATEVRFLTPVSDETQAQAIRTALLALRYVPADCNGLHCEGMLEISY